MEEKKQKNKGIIVVITILILLVLGFGGYFVYDMFLKSEPEENNIESNVNNVEEKMSIDDVVIKNSEVKELYNYVAPNLKSQSVCLGYYYQNSYQNHTLEDKVGVVIFNYGQDFAKQYDDAFLSKAKQSGVDVFSPSEKYIEASVVKEGLKLFFNIEVEKFDNNSYGPWKYIKEVDAFIDSGHGGGYMAEIKQQVIGYNESDDEIELTVVKAEIDSDNNVYRYVNKAETLVYKNSVETFKFTDDNVEQFPQLKYIFKKNDFGKYYVSDILNLNYQEDFERCE